jgi:hypothetical protein
MRATRTRLWWLLGWAGLTGCFSLGPIDCGLRTTAGGPCDPFSANSQCASGYFCALTETCTQACLVDATCRVPCSADDAGVGFGCAAFEACIEGFCASSRDMRCIDGFCQGNCATPALDGGCDYDVYGPRSFGDKS